MVYLSHTKTWSWTQKNLLSFLFLHLILLANFNAQGQSREELEQRRYEIIQKIDESNELLKQTSQNKTILLSDLVIIESQMANRKELLKQVEQEMELIDADILSRAFQKEAKQRTVDSLKVQYHMVLRAVYRERALHNPLIALLSAESVSQQLLKANVYSKLRDYVADKLLDIKEEQAELESQIKVLNDDKEERRQVLKQIAEQNAMLENEQARQKVMIASLKEDEVLLKSNLEKQKRDRELMNNAIESVLKSEFVSESAEESGVTVAFSALKGKMPWPVTGGVISGKYGRQAHPTMRNITINNNGVDIRAPQGAAVRSVFKGKVVSVSQMSGFGVTVIIDHGTYFTVYSRMENSSLQQGDQVATNQEIGRLEIKDGSSELHFEIWKDNKTQNPEEWVRK